jgi:prepilin-type N-terminal cleavage/methylation domain-containing protein
MSTSKSERNRAFTLIEILVVLVIIVALAAMLLPVFKKGVTSAKKSRDLTHLKQIGTSLLLYRENYDHADSGTAEEMGLPTSDEGMEISGILKPELKPSGPNKSNLVFLFTNDPKEWIKYSREYEGQSVLLGDLSWTDSQVDALVDSASVKSAAGFYLSGQIKQFKKKGDALDFYWWN